MSATEFDYARNLPVRGNMAFGVGRILSMPRCRVVTAAPFTFVNGAQTAVPMTLRVLDTDGMIDLAANPTRVTIKTDGAYDVKQFMSWAASAAGNFRQAWVSLNGGTSRYAYDAAPPNATIQLLGKSDTLNLKAGDYLELVGVQDSGGNLALSSSSGQYNAAELLVTLMSTT